MTTPYVEVVILKGTSQLGESFSCRGDPSKGDIPTWLNAPLVEMILLKETSQLGDHSSCRGIFGKLSFLWKRFLLLPSPKDSNGGVARIFLRGSQLKGRESSSAEGTSSVGGHGHVSQRTFYCCRGLGAYSVKYDNKRFG